MNGRPECVTPRMDALMIFKRCLPFRRLYTFRADLFAEFIVPNWLQVPFRYRPTWYIRMYMLFSSNISSFSVRPLAIQPICMGVFFQNAFNRFFFANPPSR